MSAEGSAHHPEGWVVKLPKPQGVQNSSRESLKSNITFSPAFAAFLVVFIALFIAFVDYAPEADDSHVQQYYMYFIHVSIMIFIGFGFLMTFLRRYSYTAVALNFVASCFVVLEAILLIGVCQQFIWGHSYASKIQLDLPLLIDALFCAGSTMISFGGVIGKTTPSQLMWLVAMEVPLYALNASLATHNLHALDVGGSITIHAFGAYYGLAASLFITKRGSDLQHPKNHSSYTSDITSMIGTIFLWIYWPSFNGALASNWGEDGSMQQFYCVVHTVLSLCGACIATFIVSALVRGGQFDMVHAQNATLAGGVAIGAACNLKVTPGGALLVGACAGVLSTVGFTYLSPALDRVGVSDTCGIHNLHGLPGILGGLVAGLVAESGYNRGAGLVYDGTKQLGWQIAAIAVTLAIAITGGAVAGFIVDRCDVFQDRLIVNDMFEDALVWHAVVRDDAGEVASNCDAVNDTRHRGTCFAKKDSAFAEAGN